MPIVTLTGYPPNSSDSDLVTLRRRIQDIFLQTAGLKLTEPRQITVTFPAERAHDYDTGTLVIKVTDMVESSTRTRVVIQELGDQLIAEVKTFYHDQRELRIEAILDFMGEKSVFRTWTPRPVLT